MEINDVTGLGKLSKPIDTFLKKLATGAGVLIEPHMTKKNAKAQAEAAKIAAESKVQVDIILSEGANDLQQRAVRRFVHKETRKQENIEAIAIPVLEQLPEYSDVDNLEEDWVANFFNKCENISDEKMQTLWSRILLREATKSGTISKRALEITSTLDKKDAELFTNFGQFVWMAHQATPMVMNIEDEIYNNEGINFQTLNHLDAIGLIKFDPHQNLHLLNIKKSVLLTYYNKEVILTFDNDKENQLAIGKAWFTQAGAELFEICGSSENKDYFSMILDKWNKGPMVVTVLP